MSVEDRLGIVESNDLNARNCSLSYIFKYFHPGTDERHIQERIISRVQGNDTEAFEGRDVMVLMNLLVNEGLVVQTCAYTHFAYIDLVRHVIKAVSTAFDLQCETSGGVVFRCSADGGASRLSFAAYSRMKQSQYEREMVKKGREENYKLQLGDGQFGKYMKVAGIDFVSILRAVIDRDLNNQDIGDRMISIKMQNKYSEPVVGDLFSFDYDGHNGVYTEMNHTGKEVTINFLCEGDAPGDTEEVIIRSRMTLKDNYRGAIGSKSASMFGELAGHIFFNDRRGRPKTGPWLLKRLKHVQTVSLTAEEEDENICEHAYACVDRYHPSNNNVMIYFYGSFSGVMHHVCEALTVSLLRVIKTYKNKGREKRMSFNSGGGFEHIFQLTEKLYSFFAAEPDFDWILTARREHNVNILRYMSANSGVSLTEFITELQIGFSENKPETSWPKPTESTINEKARVSQLIIRFDVIWRIMCAMLQIPRLRGSYEKEDSFARTTDYAQAMFIVNEYDSNAGLVDINFLTNHIDVYEMKAIEELYTVEKSAVAGIYSSRVMSIFASFLEYDAGIVPD